MTFVLVSSFIKKIKRYNIKADFGTSEPYILPFKSLHSAKCADNIQVHLNSVQVPVLNIVLGLLKAYSTSFSIGLTATYSTA